MADDLYTLAQVADLLAKASGGDDDKATYIHRRLREFHRNRVLPVASYSGQGRTAAALFAEETIYRAALVLHVSDAPLRLNIGEQADFADAVGKADCTDGVQKRTFAFVINDLREGKPWDMHLKVFRDYGLPASPVDFRASIKPSDNPPRSLRAERGLRLSQGRVLLGMLSVPLDTVLLPVIAAMKAEG